MRGKVFVFLRTKHEGVEQPSHSHFPHLTWYTFHVRSPSALRCCRLFGLEADTPVANGAAKIAQAASGGVSSEAKESVEVLLDSIRASRTWPGFTKMLDESGVSHTLEIGGHRP